MKATLFLLLLVSTYAYSQINLDSILINRYQKLDSINILINKNNLQNKITQECDSVLDKFYVVKKEILSITDFSNKKLQKILIDPLTVYNYYDYFNTKNGGTKEVNTIKYGYTNREDFEKQLKINEVVLLGNICNKKVDVYNDYLTAVNNYVDKNLKQLGISRKTFENMSTSDQDLLIKRFQD